MFLLGHYYYMVLFSSMTYHRVCNRKNTTGATLGAGTACPSWTPQLIRSFSGVRVTRSLVFCVVLCILLFVLLSFSIGNPNFVLRFITSHHPFGIFKLFF